MPKLLTDLGTTADGRAAGRAAAGAPEVGEAADRLAELTLSRWRRVAAERRITPDPIPVQWRRLRAEGPAFRSGQVTEPLARAGLVTTLYDEVYETQAVTRLAVLGGAGAGKTSALILLLLAVLEGRAGLAAAGRERVPVPVWLPLRRWDPAGTELLTWAAAAIERDYPEIGAGAAAELIRRGRVALFLDGLDEVPPVVRARAARRIGSEPGSLRVVLASRPASDQEPALAGATVIELAPVGAGAAAACLLASQTDELRKRWAPVAAYLYSHPEVVTARGLDNPLVLSLTRDACAGQPPGVVSQESSLRPWLARELLARAYPDPDRRAQAAGWLAQFAGYMAGGPDLGWWEIPEALLGRRRLTTRRQWRAAALGVPTVGLPLLLTFLAHGPLMGSIFIGLFSGLFALSARGYGGRLLGLIADPLPGPRQAPDARRQRTLPGISPHTPPRPRFGPTPRAIVVHWPQNVSEYARCLGGLVAFFWFAAALVSVWTVPAAGGASATVVSTYRGDRRASVLRLLARTVGSLGPVALVALALGANWAETCIPLSFLAGCGLFALLGNGYFAVKLAEFTASPGGRERVRVLPFLEEAMDREIMRQAGPVCVFRYPAAQGWLAALHASDAAKRRRREAKTIAAATGPQARLLGALSPATTRRAAVDAGLGAMLATIVIVLGRTGWLSKPRLALLIAAVVLPVYCAVRALAAWQRWAMKRARLRTRARAGAGARPRAKARWVRGPAAIALGMLVWLAPMAVVLGVFLLAAVLAYGLSLPAQTLQFVPMLALGAVAAGMAGFFLVSWSLGAVASACRRSVLSGPRSLRRRLAWPALAVAAGAALAGALGPRTVGDAAARAFVWALPAAVTALTSGWVWRRLHRWVRPPGAFRRLSGVRWPRLALDAVAVLIIGVTILLLVDPGLLGDQPAAGFLFPLAGWLGCRIWRAMNGSKRFAVKAGADIALSLVLGADLVLVLVWLANLLDMPPAEVAVVRGCAEWAGSVIDLPWWVWATLYALLAAATVAVLRWPGRLRPIRWPLTRGPLVPSVNLTRRTLTGVHIGLLMIALVGLAAPAAVTPALQTRLRVMYTQTLQHNLRARGELAAYQAVLRQLGRATPQQLAPLAAVVADIHAISSPAPGTDDATGTELDLASRIGQLQAATLGLGADAQTLLRSASSAADRAGFASPLRGAGDVSERAGALETEQERSDSTDKQVDQAAELAATAVSGLLNLPHVGAGEAVQIIREYFSSLIENSPLTDVIAAWAGRLSGRAPPPAQDMVIPRPQSLEDTASASLTVQEMDFLDGDPGLTGPHSEYMRGEASIALAVTIVNQVRYFQDDSGSCQGCAQPQNPDDEPPGDDQPSENFGDP